MIERNKAMLEGEDYKSDDDDQMQDSDDSDQEERKRKEKEAQKKQQQEKFEEAVEQEEDRMRQEANDQRKAIFEEVLEDVNEQHEKVVRRLQRQGSIDDDERQELLNAIADGYDDVGRIMEGDQSRQADLLKAKLERRRKRRAKIEADLNNVDRELDQAQ